MLRTMLDTDMLSEVIKSKNRAVQRKANDYLLEFGALTTSVMTLYEIASGYVATHRPQQLDRFAAYANGLDVLALTDSSAFLAGRMAGELARQGLPIGHSDPLIAAIAVEHDVLLATGNLRHYQRIADLGYPLRLTNWREQA